MIAPVIPPESPLRELVYGPQVTNRVVRTADGDVVHRICTVGDGGRVLDKIPFAALDWRPDTRPGVADRGGVSFRDAVDGHGGAGGLLARSLTAP
ncbi:hypothetical protein IU450_29140 [Nocardia abscessus]|uniref:hypothetical protein n=1 Tax=Nocardia abscessus TaxID=120957 RepID=UPI00189614FD|nr:hypothetical protein [Nocardia abscessus]MBF6339923.1 hypothetical protein [Nocardia abscessus]